MDAKKAASMAFSKAGTKAVWWGRDWADWRGDERAVRWADWWGNCWVGQKGRWSAEHWAALKEHQTAEKRENTKAGRLAGDSADSWVVSAVKRADRMAGLRAA